MVDWGFALESLQAGIYRSGDQGFLDAMFEGVAGDESPWFLRGWD